MLPIRLGSSNNTVKNWQEVLNYFGENLVPDGDFGTNTKKATERFQSKHGLIPDGVVGTKTWNLAKNLIEGDKPIDNPDNSTGENYLSFDWTPVINWETGGETYFNKKLRFPVVPGGASGVTILIGTDLGYLNEKEFNTYFAKYFTDEQNKRLRKVIGLTRSSAKNALSSVENIECKWEDGKEAFVAWTLPKFYNLAKNLWPGLDQLCESAQVALTSIVFNRGNSLRGRTRSEMRNIIPLVKAKDYERIAKEIKRMKRLWEGKNLDGLLIRRDGEAKLVLKCAN